MSCRKLASNRNTSTSQNHDISVSDNSHYNGSVNITNNITYNNISCNCCIMALERKHLYVIILLHMSILMANTVLLFALLNS